MRQQRAALALVIAVGLMGGVVAPATLAGFGSSIPTTSKCTTFFTGATATCE